MSFTIVATSFAVIIAAMLIERHARPQGLAEIANNTTSLVACIVMLMELIEFHMSLVVVVATFGLVFLGVTVIHRRNQPYVDFDQG